MDANRMKFILAAAAALALWALAYFAQPPLAGYSALAGIALAVLACGLGATSKGYGRAWALLGLLGPVGLIIVLVLPHREAEVSVERGVP